MARKTAPVPDPCPVLAAFYAEAVGGPLPKRLAHTHTENLATLGSHFCTLAEVTINKPLRAAMERAPHFLLRKTPYKAKTVSGLAAAVNDLVARRASAEHPQFAGVEGASLDKRVGDLIVILTNAVAEGADPHSVEAARNAASLLGEVAREAAKIGKVSSASVKRAVIALTPAPPKPATPRPRRPKVSVNQTSLFDF